MRDWEHSDNFGLEEGKNYFKDFTAPLNDRPSTQDNQSTIMQNYITTNYENIPCLLLPYPGKVVKEDRPFKIEGNNTSDAIVD